MSTDAMLQKAESLLAGLAQGTAKPEPNRLDVVIQPSDLVAATTALRGARWGYLAALTGVDLGKDVPETDVRRGKPDADRTGRQVAAGARQ